MVPLELRVGATVSGARVVVQVAPPAIKCKLALVAAVLRHSIRSIMATSSLPAADRSSSPASGQLRAVTFDSELGWMVVAASGRQLTAVSFGHSSARRARRALADFSGSIVAEGAREAIDDHLLDLIERLRLYASGNCVEFRDVPLDLKGRTSFQRRVMNRCRQIPWGATLSYGELAAGAGSPRAARAVGSVMATNRFPLIVPCHRVVGSCGALGGYSAPAGLAMKKRLLRMEGVPVTAFD